MAKAALRQRQTPKNADLFAQRFTTLNNQQKLAVEAIEGPVLVVAGPGTGKTQVVALRVANILRKTHMRPRNILCLTFSKSGAMSMRTRLRDIIGADAYGVTVDTIHGFCNGIIQQYPIVFEEWSARKQISDIERYREVNAIIDTLPAAVALVSKKAPYARTKDILMRMSQLKREGVTDRDQLLAIAETYEKTMAEKSREGTKAHARNLRSAQKFREFLDVFFGYQDMLQRTGRYDYDDMILRVVQAFQTEDWLLANLQERYQYVLLDEFQDTNGAQYKCVELLTTDPTADNAPNFFAVGDDDQAIYRFQGANLTNILSFRKRFPNAPVIPLTISYRCSQPILDAAGSLIRNNTERLVGTIPGLEKNLVSARGVSGSTPTLFLSASDRSESWLVADLIEDRIRNGVQPNDIAVLVQTNAELFPLYDVLQARHIPVELSGRIDLLSQPLVRQILCILQAVETPETTSALGAALGCACFGCHPADLAQLFQRARDEKKTLLQCVFDLEECRESFRAAEALLHARDCILSLHQQLASRTVVDTLEHALKDSGLLLSLHAGNLDLLEYAAVQEFFDRVKQRAYESPAFNFRSFLSDLSFYDNDEYGDLRMTYDMPHLIENGVQLMTAHKSKGLEFDVVIIPNFSEGTWDARRNPPSLSVPEDLLFGWQTEERSYQQQQDERRVAFVAMTRAKSELLFTCAEQRVSGDALRALSPSAFFAEAAIGKEERRDVREPEKMSTLLATPVRAIDSELRTFLKRRLENFALSPTSLNDFLEDPQLFLERHLLLVPQAKTIDFAYGNAVHHVLAKWGQSVVQGNLIQLPALLETFRTHLQREELLPAKDYARIDHLGTSVLTAYFNTALQPPYPIISKVEFDIAARIGDVPIKGKIDRIDLYEEHSSFARVLDYKTGKPKSPKQIDDMGYGRQLVFYALLIEHSTLGLDPKEFALEFVGHEEDEPIRRVFDVTAAQKKELVDLLEKVWKKIIALDFTPL